MWGIVKVIGEFEDKVVSGGIDLKILIVDYELGNDKEELKEEVIGGNESLFCEDEDKCLDEKIDGVDGDGK